MRIIRGTGINGLSGIPYMRYEKDIETFKRDWFDYFNANMPDLVAKLNDGGALAAEDKEALSKALEKFRG